MFFEGNLERLLSLFSGPGGWQTGEVSARIPPDSGAVQGVGVTRVSLHSIPLPGLARQHRNLQSALRRNNETAQIWRGGRGFNSSFPPLLFLSAPMYKLICEQTAFSDLKKINQEALGCSQPRWWGCSLLICSDTFTRVSAPCLCGKACKIVSIQLLQLPLTQLPKHIFRPFLTEASV